MIVEDIAGSSVSLREGACGRHGGTVLRPGFADQRFRRILSTPRNALFFKRQFFVFVGCHFAIIDSIRPMNTTRENASIACF